MRVAISGYYGFDNTGDEAILLAITGELKRLGHEPVVLSAKPEETARRYGVQAVHRMRPLAVLNAINNAPVFLSGGGGLLQDKTSSRTLQYYLALIRLARMLGRRTVVFNQSVGPLSPNGERAVRGALRGVHCIAREAGSRTYLERLGLTASLGGDPALLLQSPDVSRDRNLVVLAPRGGQPLATDRLLELGSQLRSRGRRVLALGLQPGTDTPETQRLAEVADAGILETGDPNAVSGAVAGAGAVVGVRLHALILAAGAETPFVGVSYDPKVAAFCEDAGASHYGLDFPVAEVLAGLSGKPRVDWQAVQAMRERSRASFLEALGG